MLIYTHGKYRWLVNRQVPKGMYPKLEDFEKLTDSVMRRTFARMGVKLVSIKSGVTGLKAVELVSANKDRRFGNTRKKARKL